MEKNRLSTEIKYLSLSAVLFFAPFIQQSLKNTKKEWSNEEKAFLLSRCWVGNMLWWVLLVCLLTFGGGKLWGYSALFLFSEVLVYLLFVLLGASVVLLSSGLYFEITSLQQSPAQKKQMLISFLPLWSSYQRFRSQNFEKPYRWLKEAQVWLSLILVCALLFPSGMPALVTISVLLLRVFLLALGKDVFAQEWKLALHRSFICSPWEILSRWCIKYCSPAQAKTLMFIAEGSLILIALASILWLQLWWKIIPLLWWLVRVILRQGGQKPLSNPPSTQNIAR